jgi:unsaturated chondroitin disaccharide hydrolase
MYERTRDPVWKARAEQRQDGIESRKTDNTTHDIGFQIFTTFANGYRLTGNDAYRQVALTAAATLATRYNAIVGAIRSWDAINDATQYRVIIDNMMNLELLFWASQQPGGNANWKTIAAQHALTSARDHVRADGGSWQVVNYDQTTGAVLSKATVQGYSDNSTWSRGEAWGIHGFTMAYRYTKDARFLATARKMADYYISHLPADKVPYWDFNAPVNRRTPRDSSAAAIAAGGLLELSEYESDLTLKDSYFNTARDTLASLSSPAYLAEGTTNQAVLLHGTQNKPGNNFDTGLIFGDYYFLDTLKRYDQIAAGNNAPQVDFNANARLL